MDPRLLARSLLVGLAVAAPIGPIGVLVIKRSLLGGGRQGFVTGLGAATADATFALAAALGLGALVSTFPIATATLRIIGALFLLYLGGRAFARGAPREAPSAPGGAFTSTFLLTLSSPVTILSFAAIASSLGVRATEPLDIVTLVLGVFAGSAAWWFFLSATIARLRRRIAARTIRVVDRLSAVVLIAFGVVALFAR